MSTSLKEHLFDNAGLAGTADRIATLLEAEDSDDHRIGAWRKASRAIRSASRPVSELVAENGVEGIHELGIGYLIGGQLADFLRGGRLTLLEHLEARSTCGNVFQRIPGIGPKLAREVRHVLGVQSLDGLARAAKDGSLSAVCGFGPRRTRLVASALAPLERRVREDDEDPSPQLDLWAAH